MRKQVKDLPKLEHVSNEKKLLQSILMSKLLSDPEATNKIADGLINAAAHGDLKAFVALRDTIGEKPFPQAPATDHNVVVTFAGGTDGEGYAD